MEEVGLPDLLADCCQVLSHFAALKDALQQMDCTTEWALRRPRAPELLAAALRDLPALSVPFLRLVDVAHSSSFSQLCFLGRSGICVGPDGSCSGQWVVLRLSMSMFPLSVPLVSIHAALPWPAFSAPPPMADGPMSAVIQLVDAAFPFYRRLEILEPPGVEPIDLRAVMLTIGFQVSELLTSFHHQHL
jgi:hypothetical protein